MVTLILIILMGLYPIANPGSNFTEKSQTWKPCFGTNIFDKKRPTPSIANEIFAPWKFKALESSIRFQSHKGGLWLLSGNFIP